MKVKSYNFNELSDFNNTAKKDIANGFTPTIAICFSDVNFDYKSLESILSSYDIDSIGTTTCGEIHDKKSNEASCSMLLMELGKDTYHIHLEKFDGDEEATSEKIANIAISKFEDPAIITYASKVGVNGDKVVRGYKKVLKPASAIFGGLAGDNFRNEEFIVFANSYFEPNGLVALILDGSKIRVEGSAYSGWEELGKTHTVTKAEGNVVHKIDNQPALNLFIEYFGIEDSEATKGQAMETIPGIYPLKVIDKNNVEYMRSPLFYDRENQALILGGEVKEGELVKFCPMPGLDTIANTVNYFKEYAQKHPTVDSVIINSCAGRKMAFGPLMDKELEDIYDIWNVPTAGFLALGEIGSNATDNECNFHNVTCSLVTISEINN